MAETGQCETFLQHLRRVTMMFYDKAGREMLVEQIK